MKVRSIKSRSSAHFWLIKYIFSFSKDSIKQASWFNIERPEIVYFLHDWYKAVKYRKQDSLDQLWRHKGSSIKKTLGKQSFGFLCKGSLNTTKLSDDITVCRFLVLHSVSVILGQPSYIKYAVIKYKYQSLHRW